MLCQNEAILHIQDAKDGMMNLTGLAGAMSLFLAVIRQGKIGRLLESCHN